MKTKSKWQNYKSAWYMYDWAISAFSTSVLTVFLNPYLTSIATKAADANGFIYLFGLPIFAGSFFEYVISASVLLQIVLLPLVGAITDSSPSKKKILLCFSTCGALASTLMFFISDQGYVLGAILLLLSNICFGCAMVIYNSFLNDISSESDRDEMSSKGFAWGYIGGGLMLAVHLALLFFHKEVGITNTNFAIRIALSTSGLWWLGFGTFAVLHFLSKTDRIKLKLKTTNYSVVFKNLNETFKSLKSYPNALLFLIAYLFYNDGIQSVIIVAGKLGSQKLGISVTTLALIILMVQFIAYVGSIVVYRVAHKIGSKLTLVLCLLIWIITLIFSFFFLNDIYSFIAMSIIIASVLGGSQALSRSIFSKLIPPDKTAEYFSFYELSERSTSWMGPFAFGLALQITHSYNIALLSLVFFFIIGTAILLLVKAPNTIDKIIVE